MNIACIGTGFVGVVTSAVFAKLGNQVVGLDIDALKIAALRQGVVPFYEPDLSELLVATQKTGNLSFTSDYAQAISMADIVMIMVGTPSAADGQADLKYVYASAESLAPHLKKNTIVIIKSTVPPGTNAKVKEIIKAKTSVDFELASVPEFLKEGTAVADTLHPDRIVIGVESDKTKETLISLHKDLTTNIIVMRPESAQMCKYASNNYLATRITFINQIADLCEVNGADIQEVIKGIGEDKRIGKHYWYPGLGYGGSCFPKDVKEIAAYAKSVGEKDSLFIKVDSLNETRIEKLMIKYNTLVGEVTGKTITLLGTSFKKNTNDEREAPAIKVAEWLRAKGATVKTVDPKATADFTDPYDAIVGSHAVMLLVEWDEFTHLDLTKISNIMLEPKYFFDTRNQYDKLAVEATGLKYKGVGR